ncbi:MULTISPECIES: ROK family protein [unclassified Fredinandcohnia]|uniref:ROK family protein n=1 Tax=unclassified Fredinandcohnia TaxID=2837514 RepID=UPI0030FD88FD
MNSYMVFDIGGTFIKYAVMNERGLKLEGGKIPTPQEGLESFLETITEITNEYRQGFEIEGIAISSPGAVNVINGYIGGSSAIPYIHGISLTELIKERTGLDVSIENDANCAALAEGWIGAAKEIDYYICIVIGTGIGGSIVMNHTVLRGATLQGGEFGYMIMGDPLRNPLKSTWSLVASTNALAKEAEHKKSLENGTLNGEKVFRMAEEGDPIAKECITLFYKRLAAGIYNIKYALDPEKILIGGGISKRPDVIEGINNELKLLKNEISTPDISVEPCQFDNDANLIGALHHFLTRK